MLENPFTPSEIASSPDDFFGRYEELKTLERSLNIGSVAIQGAIGIGKSSLLAHIRLQMEGFGNDNRSKSVIAVGNRDIQTINDVAKKILEDLIAVDEKHRKFHFKLPYLLEFESNEIVKYFEEGRHLAVLQRLLEKDYLDRVVRDNGWLIIAIDEADKCPVPIARFVRSLVTHTQQRGIKNVRFILCGVHPFYEDMVNEDSGISRFIYKTLTLQPLPPDEADELLNSKFSAVVDSGAQQGFEISVHGATKRRIRDFSGGHPHLMQLLGSHVVESECDNPDGKIDGKDLLPALTRICYEDRANVYDSILHTLDLYGKRETFDQIIADMRRGFPSRIDRQKLLNSTSLEDVAWFLKFNIISVHDFRTYSLTDEFLRIRMILDRQDIFSDDNGTNQFEKYFMSQGMSHNHIFYGDDGYEEEDEDE